MKLMSTLRVTHFANRIDFLLVPSRLVTKTDWHALYFIQSLKFHPQITSWSTSFQALNGTLQCAISNFNSPLVNLSRSFQFPEPVYSTCLMSKTYWSTCTGPLIKVMQNNLPVATFTIHPTHNFSIIAWSIKVMKDRPCTSEQSKHAVHMGREHYNTVCSHKHPHKVTICFEPSKPE